VRAPVVPRGEEVPWPAGLVRARAPLEEQALLGAWREAELPWPAFPAEDSSGGVSERPSRAFDSPNRTQRRRMQRRIKKITDRQMVSEDSNGTRTVGMFPGHFVQPASACFYMFM
ncbi:unnamed protein product, partial [Prorocentrum cordatum]